MTAVIVIVLLLLVVGALLVFSRLRAARALEDARAEARRWHEQLGGQLSTLDPQGSAAARQALADASERFNAAGGEIASARSVRQVELARDSALEGLSYVRAARTALGLDPGPALPLTSAQRAAGEITVPRSVEADGRRVSAAPHAGDGTPYYYPGGVVAGRRVPRGWYSEPWWRAALIGGAWGLGSALLFSALFSPVFADPGYDAGLVSGDVGDSFDGDSLDGDSSDGDSSDGDYEVGGFEDGGDSGDSVDSFDSFDGGDSFSDFGGGDF
ncbi:hypothetical protein [Virgisporangium aliadipatigenens]|nr:hypothetical protein [Virgisporangium aliadipatigenens]